jgi:imidazolonepropionase-like amidohydrolase
MEHVLATLTVPFKYLAFTLIKKILVVITIVTKMFMREDELGKLLTGYLADLILVDGNPRATSLPCRASQV